MKKLAVSLALMTATIGAFAQQKSIVVDDDNREPFETGKCYINVSATNLGLSYSKQEKLRFGVEGTAGYFFADALMATASIGYEHTHVSDDFSASLGGRYYIVQNGLYLGLNVKYSHTDKSNNNLYLTPQLGYAFFLNRHVTVEPSVYYDMSFNDYANGSKVGLKIGFGYYF
jgi:hypothetical protein